MRRKKSAISLFFLPSFSITFPLLIFFLFVQTSIAFTEYSEQLIMADELPREEIALLYQRLKSGDSTVGGGRRGSGRTNANAKNARTNGTTDKGGGGQKGGGRRKIGE
jgi:hypothetical protein